MDILISVGASEFGFDRLLRIIDKLCEERVIDGNHVLAQIGCSKYIPQNYNYFRLIDHDDFVQYLDKANLVICHAGTGSVIPALKKKKKIIVFPRMKEFNEHIDNHQLELAEIFTQSGYTMCAHNEEELRNCIQYQDTFKLKEFISNTEEISDFIIETIKTWFGSKI